MLTRARTGAFGYLVASVWVGYFAALQWSVVRFEPLIVATLTTSALALAFWQWRRTSPRAVSPRSLSLAFLGSALVLSLVPMFSYLDTAPKQFGVIALTAAALAAAVLLWRPRAWTGEVVLAAAVAAYVVVAALAIIGDPAPRIDVWIILQQGAEGLLRGENFYDMTWVGSPGVRDLFTYLPWSVVLLSPGRWLAGDVRWMLAFWTLVGVVGMLWLGRGARHEPHARWAAGPIGALLLLAPGTLTQVEQGWTEPLLFAGVVWWAALVSRGRAWWAVIPLALACASKQHVAVLLPILLVWRPFGWRRTLATGGLAAILVAPWVVVNPSAFVNDALASAVSSRPIRFANTLYLLLFNEFDVTLPFAITFVVILGTLAAVIWTVHRRQPGLAELLRWLALMLLVANLVNKVAFYNQYWLVGALVATSLAAALGFGAGDEAGCRGDPADSVPTVPLRVPRSAGAMSQLRGIHGGWTRTCRPGSSGRRRG